MGQWFCYKLLIYNYMWFFVISHHCPTLPQFRIRIFGIKGFSEFIGMTLLVFSPAIPVLVPVEESPFVLLLWSVSLQFASETLACKQTKRDASTSDRFYPNAPFFENKYFPMRGMDSAVNYWFIITCNFSSFPIIAPHCPNLSWTMMELIFW